MATTTNTIFKLSAARLPYGIHYSWVIVGILAMVQVVGSSVSMAAGLVIYATGSFVPILIISIAGSLLAVPFILALEPTSRILIPNWEESLPPEARSFSQSPAAAD